jgi:FkbM family methyltransferase
MSLIERIMQEPELRSAPPVLVDVGAAGGVNPLWRGIARYCIGVGFEPDGRDSAKLHEMNGSFLRWIYCDRLVVPTVDGPTKPFYLTKSPHCSSLLKPRSHELNEWMFASLFAVERVVEIPSTTLASLLSEQGLDRIDWLKCDTQGQDLSVFMSLPAQCRSRMQVVEFEPGIIDAYEGEDKLWHTLRAMDEEPYWVCDLQVCGNQRGSAQAMDALLGPGVCRWFRRLGPVSPGWVNVRYFRCLAAGQYALSRRDLLLAWVFADILGHNSHAALVAVEGEQRFGAALFKEMKLQSLRRIRWAMLRGVAGWFWRRIGFGQ